MTHHCRQRSRNAHVRVAIGVAPHLGILVEAKAHLNELYSPATAASAESSLTQIQASLAETAQGLGVPTGYDWSKQFY